MVIDADVAETNIALMRPGLRGEAVLDGFPDRPFAVEVSRIAPMPSREKGTVTLRLSLSSPPSDMRPAMAARIRIRALRPDSKTIARSRAMTDTQEPYIALRGVGRIQDRRETIPIFPGSTFP